MWPLAIAATASVLTYTVSFTTHKFLWTTHAIRKSVPKLWRSGGPFIYRAGKNTGLFSTVNNWTYNNNSNMHKIIYSIQGINVY